MIEIQTGFRQFVVECIIGVYAEEREKTQKVIFDLDVTYDGSQAIATDDEFNAVDYTQLAATIQKVCGEGKFGLLETQVYHCAKTILDQFPRVMSLRIYVQKPLGLPGSGGSFAGITLTRE